MRVGVRVGATRAHGALVDHDRVLAAASVPLADAARDGAEPFTGLLRELAAAATSPVTSVTWDVSAVLEAALGRAPDAGSGRPAGPEEPDDPDDAVSLPRARPVAAIRVVPRTPSAPGFGRHPSALVRSLVAWRGTVTGGHDLFGTELAALDLGAARKHAETAEAAGLTALAIVATGATASAVHEEAVAAQLLERFPDLRLCLSHETGGLGLLEREATTVFNAALFEVAEDLIGRCERATEALDSDASCWFAAGDGGRVSAKRLRWLPVLGMAATVAAALLGAAVLSGSTDALVVLTGPSTIAIGQVRDGLPHVEPELQGSLGVRMAAPQPVLTVSPADSAHAVAAHLGEHSPEATGVVAVLDEGGDAVADQILSRAPSAPVSVRPDADLAAVGAASSEPSAWLDLWVTAATVDELHRRQSQAEQQALALLATNGARPGSERIVRSVATSLGFLRSDSYRLLVRASSGSEPGTAQ